jgi:hypothetical protein
MVQRCSMGFSKREFSPDAIVSSFIRYRKFSNPWLPKKSSEGPSGYLQDQDWGKRSGHGFTNWSMTSYYIQNSTRWLPVQSTIFIT